MRERDQAITRSTGHGTPKVRRGSFCDDCDARLMWVRFRENDGHLGSWIPCDPLIDLSAGVAPTIAWEWGRSGGERARVGWVVTSDRPRRQGMRMTTAHPATCSRARRRDVPANARPVGETEMADALTLFDSASQSTTPTEET